MLVLFPKKSPRHAKQQGFTLIELLVVIAIVLILAGITFGISRGVQNAQARAKAKGELALMTQGLEQFKSTYGDYPWIGETADDKANASNLLRALTGWAILEKNAAGNVSMQAVPANEGPKKSFVDASKLSLSGDFPATGAPAATVYLLDPWGNQYAYIYRTDAGGNWDNFGYVLFSEGSDGNSATVPNNGIIDQTWRDRSQNIDNIYGGE